MSTYKFPFPKWLIAVLAAMGIILTGCSSEETPRFDTENPVCMYGEINLCFAANGDQATVEADVNPDYDTFELVDFQGAPVTQDDQGDPIVVGDTLEVVCFDDDISSVGVLVPNADNSDFAFAKHDLLWTLGQIDGKNFQPIVMIAAGALEEPQVTRGQLTQMQKNPDFMSAISCTNPLVAVSGGTASALDTIATS